MSPEDLPLKWRTGAFSPSQIKTMSLVCLERQGYLAGRTRALRPRCPIEPAGPALKLRPSARSYRFSVASKGSGQRAQRRRRSEAERTSANKDTPSGPVIAASSITPLAAGPDRRWPPLQRRTARRDFPPCTLR